MSIFGRGGGGGGRGGGVGMRGGGCFWSSTVGLGRLGYQFKVFFWSVS